ncbi:substrate-binding protein-like domain-containing protein [Actinomyces ruminicola]|uniref:Substrate-binding protein-like domain-containing protein n=1 Tax=Actinomyces ruminicola TaxID=332524 RepID=A0A1G9YZU0_9ACTO|nr:substrate-binding protein-like domain-containing protein [Actinomyces ruminicola]
MTGRSIANGQGTTAPATWSYRLLLYEEFLLAIMYGGRSAAIQAVAYTPRRPPRPEGGAARAGAERSPPDLRPEQPGVTTAIRPISKARGAANSLASKRIPSRHLIARGWAETLSDLGLDTESPRGDTTEVDDDARTEGIRSFVEGCISGQATAIIAHSDEAALVVVELLAKRGLSVPGDVCRGTSPSSPTTTRSPNSRARRLPRCARPRRNSARSPCSCCSNVLATRHEPFVRRRRPPP